MGAPCINDTCSISSQIDPVTRRLQLDVNLASNSAIECVEGTGLGVKLYGDPAPVGTPDDACFNTIGITTAGDIFAVPQKARVHSFAGSVVNIPQGAGSSGQGSDSDNTLSSSESFTNPFACQATMLVFGRYEIGYTITSDPPDDSDGPLISSGGNTFIPYNAKIMTRVEFNGTNVDIAYFDVGGIIDTSVGKHKQIWQDFAFATTVPASGVVAIDAFANHDGDNGAINISTVSGFGSPFSARGFKVTGKAVLLPMNSRTF